MKLCNEIAAILHLVSAHTSQQPYDYNNRNYGAGISCQVNENVRVASGAYENSFRKTSAYVLGSLEYEFVSGVSAGAFIGPATGYDVPFVGGFIMRTKFSAPVNVNVILAPPVNGMDGFIHLALEFRILKN